LALDIGSTPVAVEPQAPGGSDGRRRLPLEWRRRWEWPREGLIATLPAWIAARLVIGGLSWYLDPAHPLGKLFIWDTRWYLTIARYGYQPGGGNLIHFFPLTSVVAAGIAAVTRLPVSIALFGFCWVTALVFGALVHRAVVRETGDRGAAVRAAWLTQLVPGAYALVMGFTEPLAGVLAVGYFLAVRGGRDGNARPWLAAGLGFLGGLSRPIGVLLAIPGAVEGVRIARREGWSRASVLQGAVSALAPAAGLAAYLAYSRLQFGSWMLPYSQQTSKLGRGGVMADPIGILRHVWTHNWRNHGHGLAVWASILIALFAALVLVVARRLPVSYLAWTVPSFLLAIGSKDFSSLPRYVGALFPCVIAAALVTRRRWQWAAVLTVSCALMLWTTYWVFAQYEVA
jgi:hypothetical protein